MTATPVESLSGSELRDLFAAATAWLERNRDNVDAVNVFPVPDGDTGKNMHWTMRKAVEEAERVGNPTAGSVLAAMAHGSLMEGKGNSGVILSQIIGGFAQGVGDSEVLSPRLFASGLEGASHAADRAPKPPTEGTILTVMRDVAVAVNRAASEGADMGVLFETAVNEAKESVERTPLLLPRLAEAGVVDAGGFGLSVILDGMLRRLRGESLDDAEVVAPKTVSEEWLAATDARHETVESLYGYCTELLIDGDGMDADAIRGRIAALGDAVIVVGVPSLVRVHVHTDDPGAALSVGTRAGQLVQVKVDNINRQAERFVEMHEEMGEEIGGDSNGIAPAAPQLSTVAVVAGKGMAAVFNDIGCTRTISGGPTMNPSPREILEAVDACPSEDVAVMPNDKNVILAAEQARNLTKKTVHVIGTRSMPQGIAALLAASRGDNDVEASVRAMQEACGSVRTIEVTRSVRSTSIGGVRVSEGDVIAIVDDELKLAAPSPEEAVLQSLEGLTGRGSLITLYYGAASEANAAEELARNIRGRFSSYEVEVVFGGQPHYDYIASVE